MLLNTSLPAARPLSPEKRHQYQTATPILDIRQTKTELDVQSKIRDMLNGGERNRLQIPFELLYDERGLQLFENITYHDDYYPSKTELEIIKENADRIASSFQDGSIIVELGSGYVCCI